MFACVIPGESIHSSLRAIHLRSNLLDRSGSYLVLKELELEHTVNHKCSFRHLSIMRNFFFLPSRVKIYFKPKLFKNCRAYFSNQYSATFILNHLFNRDNINEASYNAHSISKLLIKEAIKIHFQVNYTHSLYAMRQE
ncbi:hypothetical protein PUN28_009896 [Cardiocondyla obscurior]|uniref:Uncharacterized protein n=1 Tax=Cardiocondyla obscurior TaxID=286306 RepID=A0AAW2FNB5_9HYME